MAQHYRGAGGTDSRGTQLVPCWAAVVGKLAAQWGSPLRLGPLAALQLPCRQFLLREDRLFSTGGDGDGDMVGFFYDVPQVTFRLLLIWYRTSILYKYL